MATASEQILAMAVVGMETYRLKLSPGVYCFGAETLNGKPTGKIVEKNLKHASRAHEQALGILFGFWPDGFGSAKFTREALSAVPPPIMEVNELPLAPERFLTSLQRHVAGKMAFASNRFTRKKSPAPEELVARATAALEMYGVMSPPGFYRFYAEMDKDRRTGRIMEERQDFKTKSQELDCGGKVFGFWPMGYHPEVFDRNPFLKLYKDWPPIPGLSLLHQAPDEFLEDLIRHVGEKTGLQASG